MSFVVLRALTRWLVAAARGVRRAWAESAAAHRALVEINTPWRHDGELRWVHGGSGWELHGSWAPIAPADGPTG